MSTKPIDVLYCIDYLPYSGGTEGQVAGLIQRLDRERFRPHLCTINPIYQLRDMGDCPHLALDVPGITSWRAPMEARKLWSYIRRHDIRVVHTYFQDSTVFALPVAWLAGVPVRLSSFRDLGFWRDAKSQLLMRSVYRFATGFLANSQAVQDAAVAHDDLSPDKFEIIYNGVDAADFIYEPEPHDPPVVAYVGNLNRRVKRPDLFVEAAGMVARSHPEARWIVLGDGSLRPGLEERAGELGIAGSMEFLGRHNHVGEFLAKADIGINCSESEGFANAVLEYMLTGVVAVATAVGGSQEMIRHREDGLLVPSNDAAALAAAVNELLDDSELAARCRVQARQRALAEYSWTQSVSRHESLYRRLLERDSR